MSEVQKPVYGGQAVIEGVMFGGKHHTVTAVRRKDSTITYYYLPRKSKPIVQTLKKIPFLRGIVALVQSSATGSKHLNFSSEQYEDEEENKTKEGTVETKLVVRDSRHRCSFFLIWKINIHRHPGIPC